MNPLGTAGMSQERRTRGGVASFLVMVLGTIGVLSGAGCSTLHAYSGPELTEAETARIRGYDNWFSRAYVRLLNVDGHEPDPDWSDNSVFVLPGTHSVFVEAQWGVGFPSGPGIKEHRRAALTFTAEIGRSYVIETDEELNLWVEKKGLGVIPTCESRIGPRCRNHHKLGTRARGFYCPVYDVSTSERNTP